MLEQKRLDSIERGGTLHMNIDMEADALMSSITAWRQKSHDEVEAKISGQLKVLEEHRLELESMSARADDLRVRLSRALDEACAVSILESGNDLKKRLSALVEEDVGSRVDVVCEEEVTVCLVRLARELSQVGNMFEIGSRRVRQKSQKDRSSLVLLSRGAGVIGEGMLDDVYGSTDIMIPEGGSASDGLLFVPDKNRVRVFNVSSGLWIRDIVGDGGLSAYVRDVLISMTGPGGTAELYVADYGSNRVVVLDPMTGGHIRSIGMGRGSGNSEDEIIIIE